MNVQLYAVDCCRGCLRLDALLLQLSVVKCTVVTVCLHMVSFGLPEKHLEINRFVNFSCILNILNGIVPIFNAYGYCKCTCRQ